MSYKWHQKINNNTNIHLDLRQIGCYCIRPTASYNNSQYCRRSRWIFAKYVTDYPKYHPDCCTYRRSEGCNLRNTWACVNKALHCFSLIPVSPRLCSNSLLQWHCLAPLQGIPLKQLVYHLIPTWYSSGANKQNHLQMIGYHLCITKKHDGHPARVAFDFYGNKHTLLCSLVTSLYSLHKTTEIENKKTKLRICYLVRIAYCACTGLFYSPQEVVDAAP